MTLSMINYNFCYTTASTFWLSIVGIVGRIRDTITFINNHIYSIRTMNKVATIPTATTRKPRVKYDIGDLHYYTLDGFLPEYGTMNTSFKTSHMPGMHSILNMFIVKPLGTYRVYNVGNTAWHGYCEGWRKANAHFAPVLRVIVTNNQEEAENTNSKN